jgi:hypothetical protein
MTLLETALEISGLTDEERRRFEMIPRLIPHMDTDGLAGDCRRCHVCEGKATLFDVVDFLKHVNRLDPYRFGLSGIHVEYFRCQRCKFIFSGLCDQWSARDFQNFVYNDDYVKVDPDYVEKRPRHLGNDMSSRLAGHESLRILDYGSGSGVFEKAMRAHGFGNVVSYDPYSQPERPQGKFDIVTAFEVLEHSATPLATLRDMSSFLDSGGCLLAQTITQPSNIDTIRAGWEYAAPRNGHVSLYSIEALCELAARNEFIFCSGQDMHAFVPKQKGPIAELCMRITGPPTKVVTLGAGRDAGEAGWHGMETAVSGAFCWTSQEHLEWRVPLESTPCRLSLFIPVVDEIEEGFAAASQFIIEGVPQPAARAARGISTEVLVTQSTPIRVELVTPKCKRPSELNGSEDHRPLGLAILVVDES